MKIRIKGNSIRFRLQKTEVKQLSELKSLIETTNFVDSKFEYGIECYDGTQLIAQYSQNRITVFFPTTLAIAWYDSELITHKAFMDLPNGEKLNMLLEKDFVCLDHTDEDQSDNYDNPNKSC